MLPPPLNETISLTAAAGTAVGAAAADIVADDSNTSGGGGERDGDDALVVFLRGLSSKLTQHCQQQLSTSAKCLDRMASALTCGVNVSRETCASVKNIYPQHPACASVGGNLSPPETRKN
jgi:hypothetical protein